MTPRRSWRPNALRDLLIRIEKPMSRRPRRKWKPTVQGWITALGLINAAAVLIGSSATDLGVPGTVAKWVLLMGAVALIWKGMLEEDARQEALRKVPPPKEEL
jgi:hypothetical protein